MKLVDEETNLMTSDDVSRSKNSSKVKNTPVYMYGSNILETFKFLNKHESSHKTKKRRQNCLW